MHKEHFCLYLEEVAAELRLFPSTSEYLNDVCQSLIEHTMEFEKNELEFNRLRVIK